MVPAVFIFLTDTWVDMLLVTFGLRFRKVSEPEAVLNLPANPNLGSKLGDRRLTNVLSKHCYLPEVWNLD